MYRYIGNKTAILDPLISILLRDANEKTIFADPMCGTASVSEALGKRGYAVISSDILTFPTYHAYVRLQLNKPPDFFSLSMNYAEVLDYLNGLSPVEGYFSREFSEGGIPQNGSPARKYLTFHNAMKLDSINLKLNAWKTKQQITEEENILLRHDLIMAVNRVANIAGTYGHFRSVFSSSSLKSLNLVPTVFNEWASARNSVLCGPSESIVKSMDSNILYLDPPYKKRQYAANYHLLETIALGDSPEPRGLSGLRDWWPSYSDFCSKRKIESAFISTLSETRFEKIFVSYSEDGLIEDDQMVSILANFGAVNRHEITHKRFKSNASLLETSLKEFVYEIIPS
jgi:adenine-specific DNA-methyltransferase